MFVCKFTEKEGWFLNVCHIALSPVPTRRRNCGIQCFCSRAWRGVVERDKVSTGRLAHLSLC